ncbi:AIPR family protein [Enterobacter hormaechei]
MISYQELVRTFLRNMLGKTDVNEEIKKSVSENPEMFWFYNNGITILGKVRISRSFLPKLTR